MAPQQGMPVRRRPVVLATASLLLGIVHLWVLLDVRPPAYIAVLDLAALSACCVAGSLVVWRDVFECHLTLGLVGACSAAGAVVAAGLGLPGAPGHDVHPCEPPLFVAGVVVLASAASRARAGRMMAR